MLLCHVDWICSLASKPLVELLEMVNSKSACVVEEYGLQCLMTNIFFSWWICRAECSCCGYTLSCVLACLSVFQGHSEVLETSVLLDDNNLTRSQCFVLWAEGTIHASSTAPFQSSKRVTWLFLLLFSKLSNLHRAVPKIMGSHMSVEMSHFTSKNTIYYYFGAWKREELSSGTDC